MNELQQQLAALLSILDAAERNGIPVIGIQRCISEVNDQIYALRDLQRNTAAIMSNAPRCQVEESGDMLWA